MIKNNYIVYKHTFPNGKIYIGMTSQKPEKRWNHGRGYNNCFYMQKAIAKYNWENIRHEIIFEGLKREEAERKEIEMILFYNSHQRDFGYNVEFGGNKISEDTRQRMSESAKRRTISNETRKKMGESQKGKKLTKEHKQKLSELKLGKTRSDEFKKKLSNYKKNDLIGIEQLKQFAFNMRKPVSQYDLKNNYIKTFNSIKEASQCIGISVSGISSCCSGRQKSAGGFQWKCA